MRTGVQLIEDERERQELDEGWTAEHDNQHTEGELAQAGAVYALPVDIKRMRQPVAVNATERLEHLMWPFNAHWYKPTPDDRIRELQKAGALIAAEIDRLQRIKENE